MPSAPSSDLNALVSDFVASVEAAVRADFTARLDSALKVLLGAPASAKPPAAPRGRKPGRPRKAVAARKAASPAPAAPKTAAKTTAAPKTAAKTAIDPTLCHFPGCPNKHSGPRYHLFCKDHFGSLSADDLARYKALYKAQHG